METRYKSKKVLKPAQIMVLSFAGVILLGALILMLPISSQTGNTTPFIDALFTATTSVCVTGLVVVDTGTYWSFFGQIVILILIQIGGLGFMTLTTMAAIIFGKKIGLKNRLVMQEALNQYSLSGVVKLTKYVVLATFATELIGALLLSTQFIPEFGLLRGAYYSVFHSISAFCNAGIDLMGNFKSLTDYVTNPVVSMTIAILIVIGGLGFSVITELLSFKKFRKMSLHTKLVLIMTSSLVFGGAILIFLLEFNNPATIGNLSFGDKIVASLFHSITPRTAGYNTLDLNSLSGATRLITIVLMFIGGSPGSTAGGIKTTTFGIMILTVISIFKGSSDINFSKNRISKETVSKSMALVFFSIFWIGSMLLLLTIFEQGRTLEQLVFEAMSAFGTVGLSLGITPTLSTMGKIIIITMMFFGRVGPLTIVVAASRQAAQAGKTLIRYPEGKIIVG